MPRRSHSRSGPADGISPRDFCSRIGAKAERQGGSPEANVFSYLLKRSTKTSFANGRQGAPGATSLIWEHTEDEPGVACPNPRVIIPRRIVPDVVKGAVDVDIRSMGVRTPPCTADLPTYGIIGMFHKLPPALAWLWRLVAPRRHANPSIVATEGMSSEGVGSCWPFATGRRVDQANLLLNQIIETPKVRYILTPNQHIGAWEVGFMPQWITREFLARRGGARFTEKQMKPSRCPLLVSPSSIFMEGRTLGVWFFEVNQQPEVGTAAYDRGAEIF